MTATPPHPSCVTTAVGGTIAGFTVSRCVRARGCATVYRARDRHGMTVVMKTLCNHATPRQQSRFDNEEATLRILRDCPHVPRLEAAGTVDSRRYLAFVWHPGLSLRRMPTSDSRRSTAESAACFGEVALPVARAFCRLHSFGIAHGDVSRNNILVAAGMVSLIDLESAADLHAGTRAAEPHRKCTWAYAPPEYAREHYGHGEAWRPSFAADQYSVAAVLYRQLTGQRHRPSAPPGVDRDALKILDVPPLALTGWPARRWPKLPAVFTRALATRPNERFDSLPDFTASLETALSH